MKHLPSNRNSSIQTAASQSPAIAGEAPGWLRLNQLPGLMWSAIRAVGESVFGPLTATPLERIEAIANLSGHGPHSQQVIDATASRLHRQCEPANILEYSSEQMQQFFGALYQAQAIQFEAEEYGYLLVRDPMGSYIYRWPASDTKRRIERLKKKWPLLIA